MSVCPPLFQSIQPPPPSHLEKAVAAVLVVAAVVGREFHQFPHTAMSHHPVQPQKAGQLQLPSGKMILTGVEVVTRQLVMKDGGPVV